MPRVRGTGLPRMLEGRAQVSDFCVGGSRGVPAVSPGPPGLRTMGAQSFTTESTAESPGQAHPDPHPRKATDVYKWRAQDRGCSGPRGWVWNGRPGEALPKGVAGAGGAPGSE